MKKFTTLVIAAAMAIGLIGSVTPTKAEAADYIKATCVADIVAFVKEPHPNVTMSARLIDNTEIQYEWVWNDPEDVDMILDRLTEEERAELDELLEEANGTIEDMYGWQLEVVTYKVFTLWEGLE